MKNKLLLLSLLIFTSVSFAKTELPSQAAIEQVMDALVDNTDPISEKDFKSSIKYIKKGIKSHDKGKFSKAIKSYNKALEKDPLSATAHYELGVSLSVTKNVPLAYEHALKALVLEPGMEHAHVLKASLLDDAGYVDESIAAWIRLIDINPKSYMAWLNKGITHLKVEQFEPAEEAFLKAIELEANHPSGHYFMFVMNGMRGYTYEEESHIRKYLSVSKGDHRKAAAQERLGQIESFYNTINMDPNSTSIKLNLIRQLTTIIWKKEKHRETYPNEKFYRPSLAEEVEATSSLLSIMGELDDETEEVEKKAINEINTVFEAGFVREKAYVELKQYLGAKDLEWGAGNEKRIQEYVEWSTSQASK